MDSKMEKLKKNVDGLGRCTINNWQAIMDCDDKIDETQDWVLDDKKRISDLLRIVIEQDARIRTLETQMSDVYECFYNIAKHLKEECN